MSVVATLRSRRTRSSARRERAQPLDREYWLAHCEGYRVESPGGRVGLVEEVRGGEQGGTRSLAVLAGMRGLRRLIIPISEVDDIVPHVRRIVLKPGASVAASERVGGSLLG
jgi:hypothetical protein